MVNPKLGRPPLITVPETLAQPDFDNNAKVN